MKFAKDGYSTIFGITFISIIIFLIGFFLGSWISWVLYLVAIVSIIFTLYFFRDPDRVIPEDPNLLIAPADGKVLLVEPVMENTYIKGRGTQISIFLSPLNVHVNRIPLSGVIEYLNYFPGKYLVAWHEKSSELNERSEIGLLHNSGTKIFFKQITGFIARRITFHLTVGNEVKVGDRFGMMKFGSRMDIIVPSNISVTVKPGDITVAGESVMGKIVS